MRLQHAPVSYLVILLTKFRPGLAVENLPAGVDITEDTPGQVTINGDPTGNTTLGTDIPVVATLFSGDPGPSACRGHVLLRFTPPRTTTTTTEECHELPSGGAGCAVFTASKEAGCEARLFAEPGCRMYVNTAVFVPEERAVGGRWRSIGVRCGVPAPDPASLGPPPLVGLMKRPPVTGSRAGNG
ncbi:hypothetical protein VTI28DRAFT_9698 [Corynascus sepedonium]